MALTPLPPGPKGGFFTGNLPDFRRDMLGFLRGMTARYGDAAPFRLGPRRCVLLGHPDLIEQVLVTDARQYIKHFALRTNRALMGNGLLVSESDFWRRQRRLAAPSLHPGRMNGYAEVMLACTERMLAGWRDGEVVDVHDEMIRLTLDIAARTLFGADIGPEAREIGAALHSALDAFDRRFHGFFPWPEWVPTPGNLQMRRSVNRLNKLIGGLIDRRRESGGDRGDLLSALLQARDEDDGTHMTDRQLLDEARTILLAGHETTALALSWTFYLLAQHLEADAALASELSALPAERAPGPSDLPNLAYAEHAVMESMRLYPPAYMLGREPVRDSEVGGYHVPAGTTLFMAQWSVQRDSRYFDDPDRFEPARWAGGLAKRLPRFAYFPFGGGPRVCIGNSFAMMEAVLVLAAVARKFRLDLVPGQTVTAWPSLTLRPKEGIRMTLARRRGA